jgi:Tfp pilus assembly protein PilF
MAVTFPFTLLLLDVWPLHRAPSPPSHTISRTIFEKIPLIAISVLSSGVTYYLQRSGGAVQSTHFTANIRNAFLSYISYIGQFFWPSGLASIYPPREPIDVWKAGGALAILLVISLLAVLTWRTRPYIATGWFWYLGTLVPVIGLIQAGTQSHADRYMYVPMIGLVIILAWGSADVIDKWPRLKPWIATAAVPCCAACLVLAIGQVEYWRNSETVYERSISVTKKNFKAEYSLGEYLMNLPGRGPEAVSHFEAALRIQPGSADTHNILGAYLMQNGRDGEAKSHFEAALRIESDSVAAHYNLGVVLERDPDRAVDAIAEYDAAVREQPEWPFLHRRLGMLLLKEGRDVEAMNEFEVVHRLQPDPEVEQIMDRLKNRRP